MPLENLVVFSVAAVALLLIPGPAVTYIVIALGASAAITGTRAEG